MAEGTGITIHFGDVFDAPVEVLVVPGSTTGSIGASFRGGVLALGVTMQPGSSKAEPR